MDNAGEHREFFLAIREKLNEIQQIADEYGLGDDFAYFCVAGIYTQNQENEGHYDFKAMTDFFIGDEEELDRLIQVGIDVYRQTVKQAEEVEDSLIPPKALLEDILGELGISTEDDEQ